MFRDCCQKNGTLVRRNTRLHTAAEKAQDLHAFAFRLVSEWQQIRSALAGLRHSRELRVGSNRTTRRPAGRDLAGRPENAATPPMSQEGQIIGTAASCAYART